MAESAEGFARLGEGPELPAMGVAFDGDRLTCMLRADIGTGDVEGLDSMLRVTLLRTRDTLAGTVSVIANDEHGFPLALSYWAELGRANSR